MTLPNYVTMTVLFWHTYSSEVFQEGTNHGNSESVHEAYRWLIANNMIEVTPDAKRSGDKEFQLTERGEFYTHHVSNIPLPVEHTEWRIHN